MIFACRTLPVRIERSRKPEGPRWKLPTFATRFERPSDVTGGRFLRFARTIWLPYPSKPSWSAIQVDWNALDDVVYGCANQAGEDNRNVGRMALLLAGLPKEVPGVTVNRLCGSSMDAVATASRAIKCGEGDLIIAGGVESMSRAPFVMGKSDAPFSRTAKIEDSTIGWRFINSLMKRSM